MPINFANPKGSQNQTSSSSEGIQKKSEPLKDAIASSFFSFIDKKTGNNINKKIIRHPLIILIEVFNFIIVKFFIVTI